MTVEIIVKDLRWTVDNMFQHIILDTQHTEQHQIIAFLATDKQR